MKVFKTEEGALEYAANLHREEREIVLVNGKRTVLSSTCLPMEAHIRTPLEEIIRKELEALSFDGDIDDTTMYIGAELTSTIASEIAAAANVRYLSANLNY